MQLRNDGIKVGALRLTFIRYVFPRALKRKMSQTSFSQAKRKELDGSVISLLRALKDGSPLRGRIKESQNRDKNGLEFILPRIFSRCNEW